MNFEDSFRLFAINNQLADLALREVESKYGIDLGRQTTEKAQTDSAYYPQIEAQIRVEASSMAPHYEVFYSLEKSIRSLLVSAFETAEGNSWWDGALVSDRIRSEVTARIDRDRDMGMTLRSDEPIDFCTFGELSELIKSNWEIFSGTFSSKRAVERVMSQLNSLRGPIAHCSLLAEDEIVRLRLSVRDWFRLMD